ncbi:xanthine dehydrogenase family protein molybdopterin-binding subunit [Paraburkholderia elongata]|uniref:Molybdopterin-dependent oxidoreductase n=1 Tax=Paraburkholderia elongata TaxID=2675747 RepID=A0A972NWJ4_9BURK|nr:molybdopterin cofactor-binding domain-containing protein [Paraburkholderia elongata]NPT59768.1 molybdopterin-dependent oxidoreductase [Paraburkholderia elongata]
MAIAKNTPRHSRRMFLKVAAAVVPGLAIGFHLPVASAGRSIISGTSADPAEVNAWVRIGADGQITLEVARVEMGQGVATALPMLIAEELECNWQDVRMVFAPPAENLARNNVFVTMITGDSRSVRDSQQYLRQAGANACQMLKQAAAQRWNVDVTECSAGQSKIIHAKSGRQFTYGELASEAGALPVPKDVKLKDRSAWTTLGKPYQRLDLPAKVNGTAEFGMDVHVPDMLYAAVVQCPVFGGKPLSVDSSAVDGKRGIVKVTVIDNFIAVVGNNWWRAQQAAKLLNVTWDFGEHDTSDDASIRSYLAEGFVSDLKPILQQGDAGAILSGAQRTLESEYFSPFLAHTTMEPQNCTARIADGKVDLWAPSQGPDISLGIAADIAGVPKANVTVHRLYLGGGFGRRGISQDYVRMSMLIAREFLGRAVKMVWSREEDVQHDFYRPASIVRQRVALDADGNVIAWKVDVASPSVLGVLRPGALKNGIDLMPTDGFRDMPYAISNLDVNYAMRNTAVPVGFWRAVYHSQNPFARECFIDEICANTQQDPVIYRRQMLAHHSQLVPLLDAVARSSRSHNRRPKGHGVGIAVNEMDQTYVAAAVEVEVASNKLVKVKRVIVAIDCGHIVNPDTVAAQIESCVVYGLSAAFFGEVNIRNGKVVQSNFSDTPVMMMRHMPIVEPLLLPSGGSWGGVGEPPLSVVIPALANAIAAATGERVHALPLTKHGFTFD